MQETSPKLDKTPSRRKQREFAFQVLYALNFSLQSECPEKILKQLQLSLDNFPDKRKNNFYPDQAVFAWELINGVIQNLSQIDDHIARYSTNWKINRIAKIELTILRLATFELLFRPDIPPKVSINEAVELAKNFGDLHSKTFVNGILDAIARDINNGQLGLDR
ncbi:transcription antitermination factor NusB [Desulfonauticus submarinus]|uniref:Transcription antitermination protein NusB n=1 Tax=Desulfonauticus submarinus TaxID=206665 RepID=A0A1H0FEK6_9BACT|nr:transcription antitermination factor NusB [Desulfonauticus submarinus]SDN93137.1 NusB antitermination factor [Desulfonauticus submarinus]